MSKPITKKDDSCKYGTHCAFKDTTCQRKGHNECPYGSKCTQCPNLCVEIPKSGGSKLPLITMDLLADLKTQAGTKDSNVKFLTKKTLIEFNPNQVCKFTGSVAGCTNNECTGKHDYFVEINRERVYTCNPIDKKLYPYSGKDDTAKPESIVTTKSCVSQSNLGGGACKSVDDITPLVKRFDKPCRNGPGCNANNCSFQHIAPATNDTVEKAKDNKKKCSGAKPPVYPNIMSSKFFDKTYYEDKELEDVWRKENENWENLFINETLHDYLLDYLNVKSVCLQTMKAVLNHSFEDLESFMYDTVKFDAVLLNIVDERCLEPHLVKSVSNIYTHS